MAGAEEGQSKTQYIICNATLYFENKQLLLVGKIEQLTFWVVMLYGLQVNFGLLVSLASNSCHGCGLRFVTEKQ
jgi:hypothetical protein